MELKSYEYRQHTIVVGQIALVHRMQGFAHGPVLHTAADLAAAMRWIDCNSASAAMPAPELPVPVSSAEG
jgi:acyl-coenzyme A thioesterase PaaI-like protein